MQRDRILANLVITDSSCEKKRKIFVSIFSDFFDKKKLS